MGDIQGKSDQGFQREVGNQKRDNNQTSTQNEKELQRYKMSKNNCAKVSEL